MPSYYTLLSLLWEKIGAEKYFDFPDVLHAGKRKECHAYIQSMLEIKI